MGQLRIACVVLFCATACANTPSATSSKDSGHSPTDSGKSRDATRADSLAPTHPDTGSRADAPVDGQRSTDAGAHDSGDSHDAGALDAGPTPPPGAAAGGYLHRVFYEPFDDPATAVDVNDTKAPGYSFYPFTFFGAHALPASLLKVAGGTLTLGGDTSGYGAGVTTAHPATNSQGWDGVVFGGGAYFEATFSFEPANSDGGFPWPAWWTDPIEGLAARGANQWPGQAVGFEHSVELDFFEYDTWWWKGANTYGGAVHEWYGERTDAGGYQQVNNGGGGSAFDNALITVPSPPTWASLHKYGCLWVPYNSATPATPGYVQMWFDGVATTDKVTWIGTPGSPPPGTAPWTFSQTDQEHYAPILGTGPGQPVVFDEVQVWQK
jgi:hypothetical protein